MSFILALDAGHGYNTPGKRTPDGTREWTLNSKVCNYVQEILKDYDVKVIRLDDTTGETDVALQNGRMKTAVSNKVDACISVHHNAGPSNGYGNYTGVEIIVHDNASTACKNLANNILKYLPSKTGLKNRGLKYSTYFTMVMRQSFPTMIIEGGFMNGTNDVKVIKTASYQKGYAQAIVDGLIKTYPNKIVKKKSTNNTTTSNKKATKTTTGNLWLRKTPTSNTDTNKIVVIPKGTKVTVLDTSNSTWYKIKVVVKGKTYKGYSSSKWLA